MRRRIAGQDWMIWLAVAAIINSAISLYYYVRVVKYMYVDEAEEGAPTEKLKLPISMVAAVAICVFMVILIGILAGSVLSGRTERGRPRSSP